MELDADLADRYQLPPLDRAIKARILGRNWAEMVGIDLDGHLAATAGDGWDDQRSRSGRLAPYTVWGGSMGELGAEVSG
jgi:hypothetical protein